MRIAGLPLVSEGVRVYFSHRTILRTYLLIPATLSVALIAAWPLGTPQAVLRGGAPTDPFTVVVVAFLLFSLYLCGRYGSEEYAPDALGNLREYVTLTPASAGALVAGKAGFGILHTTFVLALGAPFLLAALSVSGTPPQAFVAALGVVASSGIATRMFGLLLLALFGQRKLVRTAAFAGGTAISLVATFLALPWLNPATALLALGAGNAGAPRHAGVLSLAALGAAVVMAVAAAMVLSAVRRGARTGSPARG